MGKTTIPASPEQLLAALTEIFPGFQCSPDGYDDCGDGASLTYHGVMIEFTPFFGRSASSISEKQLRAFSAIVNEAVRQSGSLENAISTCFLEHLHQIRASQILRPFLTSEAKERTHA